MKFIFDAPISYRIARALGALVEAEHEVVTVEDYTGDRSAQDEDFLPRLKADGGWVVITRDLGKKDGNWHAWLSSGVTVFFLKTGWGNLPGTDIASRLLKHWPKIVQEAARAEEGSCFVVSTTGRIEPVRRKRRRRRKSQRKRR